MGFDTYQWFAEDILSRRFSVSDGSFDLQNVLQCAKKINFSHLQKIAGSLSIDS